MPDALRWTSLSLVVASLACGEPPLDAESFLPPAPGDTPPAAPPASVSGDSSAELPTVVLPWTPKPAEPADRGSTDATEKPKPTPPRTEGFAWAQQYVTADAVSPIADTMWVGKAAWASLPDVTRELRARIAAGEAPYVFFYQWGDGGEGRPLSDFANATDGELAEWERWGEELARAIGSARAWIVLEPEYDANLPAACSPRFETAMRRIIASFRTHAPNAKLVNGPGLWKPEEDYACFRDVASMMDLQGFLLHVSNRDPACTRRSDGSSYEGGETLTTAVQMTQKIEERAAKLRRLFGGTTFFISDLAVTSCGWGEEGQRRIFAALVDALPQLYVEGVRGVSIRNSSPAENERYLGVKNEGGFGYSGKAAQAEHDRALEVLREFFGAPRL